MNDGGGENIENTKEEVEDEPLHVPRVGGTCQIHSERVVVLGSQVRKEIGKNASKIQDGNERSSRSMAMRENLK